FLANEGWALPDHPLSKEERVEFEANDLRLKPEVRDLSELLRTRLRAARDLKATKVAIEATRSVAADAMASLLGPELGGFVNDFVDDLKASAIDILIEYAVHKTGRWRRELALPPLLYRPDPLPKESPNEKSSTSVSTVEKSQV